MILVPALLTLSFLTGIGTAATGWMEKRALLGLIAVCVYLAAQISFLAARLQK